MRGAFLWGGWHGFIYVDKHDDGTGDMHRARKDSFFEYQKLIREARGE